QVSSIFFPRHPIHSRRCLFLQAVVTLPEQVDAYVVQQCRELQLPVLLRCFAHTLQPAAPASPARCPVRVRLWRVLLRQRPSLHSLRRRLPAYGSSPSPPGPRAATGSPGSRAWSFSACLGSWRKNLIAHFDSAGPRLARAVALT